MITTLFIAEILLLSLVFSSDTANQESAINVNVPGMAQQNQQFAPNVQQTGQYSQQTGQYSQQAGQYNQQLGQYSQPAGQYNQQLGQKTLDPSIQQFFQYGDRQLAPQMPTGNAPDASVNAQNVQFQGPSPQADIFGQSSADSLSRIRDLYFPENYVTIHWSTTWANNECLNCANCVLVKGVNPNVDPNALPCHIPSQTQDPLCNCPSDPRYVGTSQSIMHHHHNPGDSHHHNPGVFQPVYHYGLGADQPSTSQIVFNYPLQGSIEFNKPTGNDPFSILAAEQSESVHQEDRSTVPGDAAAKEPGDADFIPLYEHKLCSACLLKQIQASENYFQNKCPCPWCKKLLSYRSMVKYIVLVATEMKGDALTNDTPHLLANMLIEELTKQLGVCTFIFTLNIQDANTLRKFEFYCQKIPILTKQRDLGYYLILALKHFTQQFSLETNEGPYGGISTSHIKRKQFANFYGKSLDFSLQPDDIKEFIAMFNSSTPRSEEEVGFYVAKIMCMLDYPNLPVRKVKEYLVPCLVSTPFGLRVRVCLSQGYYLDAYINEYKAKFNTMDTGHEMTLDILLRLKIYRTPSALEDTVLQYIKGDKPSVARLIDFIERNIEFCPWDDFNDANCGAMDKITSAIKNNYKAEELSFKELLRFRALIFKYHDTWGPVLEEALGGFFSRNPGVFTDLILERVKGITKGVVNGDIAPFDPELSYFAGGLEKKKSLAFFLAFCEFLDNDDKKAYYLPELVRYEIIGTTHTKHGVVILGRKRPKCILYLNALLFYMAKTFTRLKMQGSVESANNMKSALLNENFLEMALNFKSDMREFRDDLKKYIDSGDKDACILYGFTIFYNSMIYEYLPERTGMAHSPHMLRSLLVELPQITYSYHVLILRHLCDCFLGSAYLPNKEMFHLAVLYAFAFDLDKNNGMIFDNREKELVIDGALKEIFRVNNDPGNIYAGYFNKAIENCDRIMRCYIEYRLDLLKSQVVVDINVNEYQKELKKLKTVQGNAPSYETMETARSELEKFVKFIINKNSGKIAEPILLKKDMHNACKNIVARSVQAIRASYSTDPSLPDDDELLLLYTLKRLFDAL